MEQLSKALSISRSTAGGTADVVNTATYLKSMSAVSIRQAQYPAAIDYACEALALARDVANLRLQGSCLVNLAVAHLELNLFADARRHFDDAINASGAAGDGPSLMKAFSGQGNTYHALGLLEDALDMHEQALAVCIQMQDAGMLTERLSEASHHGNLARIYASLGQPQKATACLENAVAIFRQAEGGKRSLADGLVNLGKLWLDAREFQTAIAHYDEALQVNDDIKDTTIEASALSGLGVCYTRLRDEDRALDYLSKSLQLHQSLGEGFGVGLRDCLNCLGLAYHEFGHFAESESHYQQALAITKGTGSVLEAADLLNLGLLRMGSFNDALGAQTYLKKAIELTENLWKNVTTDNNRTTLLDTKTMVRASQALQRAYFLGGEVELALLVAEHTRAQALVEILLAQQRGSKEPNPSTQQASKVTLEAISGLAANQKAAVVLYSHTSEGNYLAWLISSRNGALSSKELVIPQEGDSKFALQILIAAVGGASALCGVGTRDLGAFEESDSDDDGKDGPLPVAPHPVPSSPSPLAPSSPPLPSNKSAVSQLQRLTSEELASLIPEQLLAVLRLQNFKCDTSDVRQQLRDKLASLRQIITRRWLRTCHQLLVEPLVAELADESRILFIPARDLFALPFAALLDANGRHLIETHAICIAPSISTLVELKNRSADTLATDEAAGHVALAVGDPTFCPSSRLPQLEGALEEAEAVQKLLETRCASVILLSGQKATKHEVVASMCKAKYVHLATHGSADGIYLSGQTPEESFLSMAEVQSLELHHTELVVLSECDSFKGELRSDGVVGISRAFIAAGVPTLLASLWKVEDKSTRCLMTRFYKEYLSTENGNVAGDAATSLQRAMVWMIQLGRFTVPQWAAFVVYGLAF